MTRTQEAIGTVLVMAGAAILLYLVWITSPPLDTIPLFFSGTIVIGGSILVSLAGLYAFHHVSYLRGLAGEHEVAGYLYAVVGLVYGILMAFVVFAVWERYASVDGAVTAEAADLVTVFRDTQFFPAHLRPTAQADLVAYAHHVMETEWPTHGELLTHKTPDPLNPLWKIFSEVRPQTGWQIAQAQNTGAHIYTLENQRHLRHLSGEATLPAIFWLVLILGGAFTVGFSYFFHIEQFLVQASMTAVLAGLIGSVLFLIVCLNDPFTGQVHVSKYPFAHALLQFEALNNQAP
jgi:hypothetical protein